MVNVDIIRIIAIYLIVGLVVLVILDIGTGRIRARVYEAARSTQGRLVNAGQYVGTRTSIVVTVLALLVFWPAAVYGYLESRFASRKSSTTRNKINNNKETK